MTTYLNVLNGSRKSPSDKDFFFVFVCFVWILASKLNLIFSLCCGIFLFLGKLMYHKSGNHFTVDSIFYK